MGGDTCYHGTASCDPMATYANFIWFCVLKRKMIKNICTPITIHKKIICEKRLTGEWGYTEN